MSMNIYAKNGDKVVFSNPNNGYDGDRANGKKYLTVGQVYTVDHTEVDYSHTNVWLKEIPSVWFNSVLFNDAETATMTPKTQSVCKQHPLGKIPGGKGLWQVPHLGCEYPHGGCSCYCGINCVAEPTSTGEQPLSAKDFWTEYYKSDPNFPVSEAACDFAEAYTSLTFWKRWAEENTKIVKHWPGWKVELAARPSESTPQFEMCGVGDSLCGVVCSLPKLHDGKHRWKGDGHEWYGNTCAPQTSAEPTCLVCGEVEGNYRHSTETANPHYYHKFNPASQFSASRTEQLAKLAYERRRCAEGFIDWEQTPESTKRSYILQTKALLACLRYEVGMEPPATPASTARTDGTGMTSEKLCEIGRMISNAVNPETEAIRLLGHLLCQ